MEYLAGKTVLFFYPDFFGYGNIITEKMRGMGASVSLHNSKAHNSAFSRALFKVFPSVMLLFSKKYFRKILKDNSGHRIDYLLVVERLPDFFLEEFKIQHPEASRVLYMDDSIKNLKTIDSKFHYFDRVLSFDPIDSNKVSGLIFRPLFFSDNCVKTNEKTDYKYDLCFIGTCHSDRFDIISKIKEECKNKNLRFYVYLYLQSWFMFLFYKMTNRLYSKAKYSDFDYKKKSYKDTLTIENESKVILDIQHDRQVGLTMRTIEMIGMRKKIITTNQDIKNYDFYNPHNIHIIDRKTPEIRSSFFMEDYEDIPMEVLSRYSLENWVKEVLKVN